MVWYFLNGKPVFDGSIAITGPYQAGDGTVSAPSFAFSGETTKGLYSTATNGIGVTMAGYSPGPAAQFGATSLTLGSSYGLSFASGIAATNTPDTSITRSAAGGLAIGGIGNGQLFGFINTLTELTTIAAAATTDTTIQMPANSVVLAVSVRVTVVIPTAATFTVGDSGSAARFSTAAVSTAANSTDPGTKAGAYYNASALAIRITPNLTPGNNSGRVRVTIYYYSVTPPTS